MMKSSESRLTKRRYFSIKEVEALYTMINRYDLRKTAYIHLLKFYIQFKKGRL